MSFAHRKVIPFPIKSVDPLALSGEYLLICIWCGVPEHEGGFSEIDSILSLEHECGDNASECSLVSGQYQFVTLWHTSFTKQ